MTDAGGGRAVALWWRHGKIVPLTAAALLGLGVALVVYPASFILGDAARFHSFTLTPNDAVEYTLAWRALAEHGKPWPSLESDIFNYPVGFSIALMDGLPLAATVARPLLPWLPEGFHYFGVWTVFVVALQGVAGAALLRAAGVRSPWWGLAAATLALAMPIFVGRLNQSHVALCTQGLLILAIALGVLATRQRLALARAFAAAAPLALTAVAVHPLLGLQVLAFALVALWSAAAPWPRRVGAGATLVGLFAGVCAWLGVWDVASFGNQVALGAFGFSPWATLVGEPSYVREFYGSHGVEQETWLGWGCLLLLAAALLLRPRLRVANSALAWTILVLAVLAVSPWWRHGLRVADLSFLVPDFVIDLYAIHRATARLGWPLVVVASILPLAHIARVWPRRRAALATVLALALQIYASHPYWRAEYGQARRHYQPPAPPPALIAGATRLLTAAGPDGQPMGRSHWRYAKHLALVAGAPLVGGVFARPPRSAPLALQAKTPGARHIAPWDGTQPLPAGFPAAATPARCVGWETLLVCAPAREAVTTDAGGPH